jgi:hypothetical protein
MIRQANKLSKKPGPVHSELVSAAEVLRLLRNPSGRTIAAARDRRRRRSG